MAAPDAADSAPDRFGSTSAGRRRVLLKDRAYAEIKARILDGRLRPGTFLVEGGLAEALGMSKTPVRAAVGRLETEGFVTVSPQQGIVVRQISLEEIIDNFDIRLALETFVVQRLAGRITPEQERELAANLEAQRRCAEARDVRGHVQLDARFHLLLCDYAGNREIRRVMARQRDKLHLIIFRVLQQDPARMHASTDEHAALFEALRKGDVDAAVERMRAHLEYGKRSLVTP